MDQQIVQMIRDRFDGIDSKLDDASKVLKEHIAQDERYWRMIDEQRAQIALIKWLSGGLSGSAILAWLYAKFGGR